MKLNEIQADTNKIDGWWEIVCKRGVFPFKKDVAEIFVSMATGETAYNIIMYKGIAKGPKSSRFLDILKYIKNV